MNNCRQCKMGLKPAILKKETTSGVFTGEGSIFFTKICTHLSKKNLI